MAAYQAADTSSSTSTTAGGFSFGRWLKIVFWSSYTAAFRDRGYVTYERCASLSEEDVRAVVGNHPHTWVLMDRVNELRRLSEEDTVKILWVSTRHKCTVCMNAKEYYCRQLSLPEKYADTELFCSVREGLLR